MSEEKGQIVVRSSSPFKDSFMSTLGSGIGVFALAGIPALFIGGVLFFVGWKIWKSVRSLKNTTTVDSIPGDIVGSQNVSGVDEIKVKVLDEPRRIRARRPRKMVGSIIA